MITVSPSEDDIDTALGRFLSSILPSSPLVPVVQGQINRVSEIKEPNFVIYTPKNRIRLSTNVDDYVDSVFAGSIADEVLTVTEVTRGVVTLNTPLFGVDVAANTIVTTQLTGPTGGIGTYSVSVSQTVVLETLATGIKTMMQPTQMEYQIDVHGTGDNAQIISTIMRDTFGVDGLQAINPAITPLFADDPKQIPFINAEGQYEDRWVIDCQLEVNITLSVPQQFADTVNVEVISVEAIP